MHAVAMQTIKPASTREDTERTVKNIDMTYSNATFEQVAANAVHLNADERTKLIGLLK